MTDAHKAAMAAGRRQAYEKRQAAKAAAPAALPVVPCPSPPTPANEAAAVVDNSLDLFVEHRQEVEQTILELVKGIKVALPCKKSRLLRGESEYEVEAADGKILYVYTQPPNVKLLEHVSNKVRKEEGTRGSTLLLKLALPGIDEEVNQYLRSLPPDHLAKLHLDDQTLAAAGCARLEPPMPQGEG